MPRYFTIRKDPQIPSKATAYFAGKKVQLLDEDMNVPGHEIGPNDMCRCRVVGTTITMCFYLSELEPALGALAEEAASLRKAALEAINNYKGPKAIHLKTGETAIDNDDAWILVGGEDGPMLRDKREQTVRERYLDEGSPYPEERSSDSPFDKGMALEDLCSFADKL